MRRFPPIALAAALLLAAGAAAAQSPDSIEALTPGRRAIAFSVPNGGGARFGFWKVVSPTRSNGGFLTVSSVYQHQGQDTLHSNQTDISLTLGPRARRYLARTGPVRPFAETGIDLGANYLRVHTFDGVGTTRWGLLAGLDAGAGAEWFPTRRVSLAASTGFALSFQRDHANNGGPTEWSIGLRTFTSALTGQFYF